MQTSGGVDENDVGAALTMYETVFAAAAFVKLPSVAVNAALTGPNEPTVLLLAPQLVAGSVIVQTFALSVVENTTEPCANAEMPVSDSVTASPRTTDAVVDEPFTLIENVVVATFTVSPTVFVDVES